MAKNSKSAKITSIALMCTGIGLAFWGYQKSGSISSQISNVFTGSHSDNVMLLYIGGAVCIAVGLFLLIKK